MIQAGTRRKVRDNSGVREVRCIKIKKGRKRTGGIGTICMGSITKVSKRATGAKWQKGNRVTGVIVSTAQEVGGVDGRWVRRKHNGVVLRNKKGSPLGTRVTGAVPRQLRAQGYAKVVSMAEHVV